MNPSLLRSSVAIAALLWIPGSFAAADLRANDPLPPVPPGSSLPPPAPSTPAPGQPSKKTASTPSATPAPPGRKGLANHPGERRFQKLKQELGLTPAQVAKIKPIIEKAGAEMKALHDNTSLPTTQKRQKMRQIFVASFQQIKPLLTPQQLQKWKQIREERHANQTTTAAST